MACTATVNISVELLYHMLQGNMVQVAEQL